MNKKLITLGICLIIWLLWFGVFAKISVKYKMKDDEWGIFIVSTILTGAIGLLIAGFWW